MALKRRFASYNGPAAGKLQAALYWAREQRLDKLAPATVDLTREPSYWNPGARDYRVGLITVTADITITGGADGLIDGANTSAIFFANGQAVAGKFVKFDFGSGVKKRITEITWNQNQVTSNGTWKFQGSNDDSTWTDVSTSNFTFNVSGDQVIDNGISTNTTFYRYYRLLGVSGTTSSFPAIYEIQFKIAEEGGEDNTPAWTGVGGRGARTDIITVTEDVGLGASANVILNGDYGNVVDFTGGTTAGRYMQFTFPEGIEVVIDAVRLHQSNTSAQGNWKLQRSDNGTDWTDVGDPFALGGATNSVGEIVTDNIAARYWRVTTTSGTVSGSPWITEVEFRIAYVE